MTEHVYYAVGHGRKPGVYEAWADVQDQDVASLRTKSIHSVFRRRCKAQKLKLTAEANFQIKDFPMPVYKKFTSKEEAEKYVKVRRPERVSLEVDEKSSKFYAVARAKVVGLFTDYEEVKKHIADYPQPLYKKFEKLDEAKAYYQKYSGAEEDGNTQEANSTTAKNNEKEVKETEHSEEKQEKNEKAQTFYAVARGHTTGVFKSWEECQEAIADFEGAKYKKFDNEHDAKLFAEGKTEDRKRPHGADETDDGVEEKTAKKEEKASA